MLATCSATHPYWHCSSSNVENSIDEIDYSEFEVEELLAEVNNELEIDDDDEFERDDEADDGDNDDNDYRNDNSNDNSNDNFEDE